MSNFTAIGQLVTEARTLLDSIKGGAIRAMQTQFDALKQTFATDTQRALTNFQSSSNAKIAQQDQALRNAVAPILDKVTVLALTKNQTMDVSSGSIPDGFLVNSGVSFTLVETISSNPALRSGAQLQLLSAMASGIKEEFPDFNIREHGHYFRSFNVFRVSWDFGDSFDGHEWIFFPPYGGDNKAGNKPFPRVGVSTVASLIKLESGGVSGFLARGCTQGKWKFSKSINTGDGFGNYVHPHPVTGDRTGSFLIALPVAATGFIDHPRKLFALPEIG
ncbi:hypothetical protein [Vibrio lentus]|uniref:hypothetical protein n=1 Tax=Vibrio lentus TaxID=136468 RepID=UPI000C833C2F|nr:hypothetical protein [Vibrio lentus]PMH89831.1 hypothetical protein BCU56_19165 [Vibrio lentus]PMI55158.1 hypothetical protein BCU43_16455 [Vibrio lentus]PMK90828.1 hypothetical protein BCT88_00940 [Vibrio lentus]